MSLPEYRYLCTDFRGENVVEEVPFYGTWYTRRLNGPGDFTGVFRLDIPQKTNSAMLEATVPGLSTITVLRNGIPMGTYLTTVRTYSSQGKVMQVQGRSLEGYPAMRVCDRDIVLDNVDPSEILKAIWDNIQIQGFHSDLLVSVTPDTSNPGYGSRLFSFAQYAQELKFYSAVIDNLITKEGMAEFYIETQYEQVLPNVNVLTRKLVMGYPYVGRDGTMSDLTFEYPGNITQYWLPESYGKGATNIYALGAGDNDNLMLRATQYDHAFDVENYLRIDKQFKFNSETDGDRLQSTANELLRQLKVPVINITTELKGDNDPELGTYGLGDYALIRIQDARFPTGKTFAQRIIGWDVNPPSSGGIEKVKIVFSETDDV